MPLDAIEVETREGLRRVSLDKPRLTIGRLPGNDIVLPFSQISRHHAEVRQRGQDWWITDLGSTNGLRVGNRTVKEYLLHHGDRVLLAPGVILQYLSMRPPTDVTVEGTLQLPNVPSSKGGPGRPLALPSRPPEPLPAAAQTDPIGISAAALAASMPLPRRKLGLTPPPSAQATLGDAPAPPAAPDADLDSWLNNLSESPPPRRPITPPAHLEGDLPLSSPFALMRQQAPVAPALTPKRLILYTCPTCSERTAPDSPYCWSCRSTIAQPCRQCGIYLLPIQTKCPRCESPNPHTVRR